MKNRQKMIIWLMLIALLLSEITHLVSISNQVVWAQEESETLKSTEKQEKTTLTETSVNQIQSGKTTETSQTQAQISPQQEENEVSSKTQTSTEKKVAESSTKEEAASQTLKTSIQPQAGNVDDNPGAKVAYNKAVAYWIGEIYARLKAAPKLGNYTGATSILEFELPVENAPVTSATSGLYKWDYATSIYFDNMAFLGGDGIAFTGSASVSTKNGKKFNRFYLVIKRTKPGSNITLPSINLRYHGELRADEYIKALGVGNYVWNKVDYFEKGTVSLGMTGLVCNLESVDMPSKYSWFYDEWRKVSVRKIASNLSDALKSNYSKLGKNVNNTVNFTVESKVSEQYAGQVNFTGDYFSDLSQFKVDLSSNFSNYVQLEKTGSTGTKINYRMKRVKAGNFSGDCSVTINTRHDAEGRTISIYDGGLLYWALPMSNIPLDSASASFNINDDRQIWADVVEQTIELGTWSGEIPAVSKMITNVRLEDGTAINSSDYTAEITSVPSFDNMAVTNKISVKITRKSSGVTTYVQVPVKMTWGNTIQLRGYDNGTSGAYTLHKVGNSYYIRSSFGENKNYRSNGIHEYRKGMTYQSITLLRGTGRIDQLSSTYYMGFNGEVTTDKVVSSFGTSGQQFVRLGDVVQIWHKEQWRNSYIKNGSNTQYSDMHEGSVYFAVTADGFVPYRLNRLKPKETAITTKTTNAELDKQAGNLIDFLGMSGNGLKVSKITEYPDRSKAGTAKGKVLVEETIAGVKLNYEYEVNFNVLDGLEVSAKTIADISLGTTLSNNAKDYVNVKSTPEAEDKLVFEWISDPISASTVGTHQAKVRVTSPTYQVSKEITIDYKVLYGNSIVLGEPSMIALSLLDKAGNPNLVTTGLNTSTNLSMRPNIKAYRKNIDQKLFELKTDTVYQTSKELASSWSKELQTTSLIYGDVLSIESFHQNDPALSLNGAQTYVSRNEQLVKEAEGYPKALYEVTTGGYSLLNINRLTPSNQEVTQGMTHEALDQRISDFLSTESFNNVKVKEFVSYPDTSKLGTTSAVIKVEETLQSGGTFEFNYTVPFTIVKTLEVSAKTIADISLGTTLSNNAKDYVNVKSTPEAEDKLVFEWISDPISASTVGTHQAKVRVTSQSFNQSVDVVINYKVLYSNSIVMGTDPLVALSLLDDGGVPKLVATPGTAKNELTLRPLLNVYRGSMTNVLVSLKTNTVYQTPDQLATTWNGLVGSAVIEYGDVITASGTKKDDPSWQLSGSETYTSRNELLVKEAEGQTEAFYELTPNGYSLLHVNWLKPQVQEIEQGTTEAELDQRINEFLSTENYNELSVKEFEMYPDTSKLGGSMAVISVVETLKSGKTFAYSHTVPFIVKAPKLTLAADLTVENLSRSEEETNVGDELLYVYTLTNNSSVASLKSGNLSIELPDGLEVVTRSEQNVSIDELAPGKTFTYQVKVKVTDAALNQNPVVKVTGKATNQSSVEQDIPEVAVDVPGGIVNEIDTSEINLTIPTKMNFGSDEEKIISPVYKMENNSTVPVEVSVEQFTPDTELKDKNLLLKIVADGQPVTLYENNQEINRAHLLLTLDAQEIKQVSFEGSVNKQTDVSKSSSNMRLRFKSTK
ncbi:hypothetical protein IGJ66_001490 [Enterococcus sp. DIV0176]|uniref:COG1470 family protein n=1 Tax=Enterococcus sp. DIV0176 TaxID=2774758 RepID=UPI003D3002E8